MRRISFPTVNYKNADNSIMLNNASNAPNKVIARIREVSKYQEARPSVYSEDGLIEYIEVPGYTSYWAGSDGTLWRGWREADPGNGWVRLFGSHLKNGSVVMNLTRDIKPYSHELCTYARILLLLFKKKLGDSKQTKVVYLDGNPDNLAINNLALVSRQSKHAQQPTPRKRGRLQDADGFTDAPLKPSEIARLKYLVGKGLDADTISRRVGCSKALVAKTIRELGLV